MNANMHVPRKYVAQEIFESFTSQIKESEMRLF